MSATILRRLASTIASLVISAGLLFWLLQDDAGAILGEIWGATRLWPLALAFPIVALIQWIRAWRFEIMINDQRAPPSLAMVEIATRLILFNYLLPFKLGELSFPVMIKRRYGTPYMRSAGVLICCRLLDLGVVLAILLIGAAFLIEPGLEGWMRVVFVLGGAIAILAPFFGIDLLPLLQRKAQGWPRLSSPLQQLTAGAMILRPRRQRGLVGLLTTLIWLLHSIIAYLGGVAIASTIGPFHLAMAGAAGNLAFALPITGVAGLGPPQAAWASTLHLAGIDWEPAIASALICHGLLLIAVLLLAAIAYISLIWLRPASTRRVDLSKPSAAPSIR